MPTRLLIGLSLLILQVIMIVAARFSEARYYCWAPHDAQNQFFLEVVVDGRPLTADEIVNRYRVPQKGLDPRAIQHIKDILMHYELRYAKDHPAKIVMRYKTNGVSQDPWYWPPQP